MAEEKKALTKTQDQTKKIGLADLPIPADIRAGLERFLNQDLGAYVSRGMIAGPSGIFGPIEDALELTAQANDTILELSSETKVALKNRVMEAVGSRLNEGGMALLKSISTNSATGWLQMVQHDRVSLVQLFELAQKQKIDLHLIPLEEDLPDGDQPVPTMTSLEEINKYVEYIVDSRALEGILTRISTFEEFVACGDTFSDYFGQIRFDSRMKEIQTMAEIAVTRGFEETDRPVLEGTTKENKERLRGVRKINLLEIDRMLQEGIRHNLAKGLASTMKHVGADLAHRTGVRLSFQTRKEIKEMYEFYGDEYGLSDPTLTTLVEGEYFNLEHWDEAITLQVKENLPRAVEATIDEYETCIREARIGNDHHHCESELEAWTSLGKQYGVRVNVEEAKLRMAASITADNVQAGLDYLLATISDAVRNNFIGEARMRTQLSVPGFLEFIRLQKMEEEVDTKLLTDYLKQHGLDKERQYIRRNNPTKITRRLLQ